jgi:hypothetical protein
MIFRVLLLPEEDFDDGCDAGKDESGPDGDGVWDVPSDDREDGRSEGWPGILGLSDICE